MRELDLEEAQADDDVGVDADDLQQTPHRGDGQHQEVLQRPDGEQLDIAWGYGGQLIFTLPAYDLVVVITTNTRDYNPDYDGSELVWETIAASIVQ